MLFDDAVRDRVREIGCGNDALYTHLGFDRRREYLGSIFLPPCWRRWAFHLRFDPWRALWLRYPSGELMGTDRPDWLRGLFFRALRAVRVENIRYWYRMSDFRRFAAEAGIGVTFYGSLYYPYRFHAVMTMA